MRLCAPLCWIECDEIWLEAHKLYPGGDHPSKPSSLASNIRRATECAQDARYGKAVAALLSLGTCPMNADTLKEMQSKHPEALRYLLVRFLRRYALMWIWCARKWKVFLQALRQVRLVHGPSFSRTFCRALTKPLGMLLCRL